MKALECARSYLLFHPDDEDVLENASYYEGLLEGTMDPGTIKPRKVRVSITYGPVVQGFRKNISWKQQQLGSFPTLKANVEVLG